METPLYKALKEYAQKDMTRLHMPGHKGINIYEIDDLWKYDITEIQNMDNLLDADSKGIIKQTEDIYTKIYGSKKSIISTQGSTIGIQTMLTLVLMNNRNSSKRMLVDRNIHIAAINTMALLAIEPIWINGDIEENDLMPAVISAKNIEDNIKKFPEISAVYITSPNYFGLIADIKEISDICKKYDKFLLVDNAHGAHLKFLNAPCHPMDFGASICCDSLHKTLPVLTGGGLIHIYDQRLVENAKKAMALYSSTSPSYLIMLSIDLLLNYVYKHIKEDLRILSYKIKQLNKLAVQLGFKIPKGNIDPIKFVIKIDEFEDNSQDIADFFRQYKIEPEYVDRFWLVFIFSPQNTNKDFQRMEDALKNISILKRRKINYLKNKITPKVIDYKKGSALKEALFSKAEMIKVEDCLGRIASNSVITCPPAVPIVLPGEYVSRETIELMLDNNIKHINVIMEN